MSDELSVTVVGIMLMTVFTHCILSSQRTCVKCCRTWTPMSPRSVITR